MLVLERNDKESIVITGPNGDVIIVTLVSHLHGHHRIGITADRKWVITREELLSPDDRALLIPWSPFNRHAIERDMNDERSVERLRELKHDAV
jgi:sRNA-binding carbon storage regulator CsrA